MFSNALVQLNLDSSRAATETLFKVISMACAGQPTLKGLCLETFAQSDSHVLLRLELRHFKSVCDRQVSCSSH